MSKKRKILLVVIWLICLYYLFTVTNNFLADVSYTKGTSEGSISDLQDAIKLNPNEPAYLRNLGLGLSSVYKNETETTSKEAIKNQAVLALKAAYNLNPRNLLTLKSVKLGLENLDEAKSAYALSFEMIEISPTDPTLWYEKAKSEKILGMLEESAKSYEKTLELRRDLTAFPPL